jgi:hypothetical protein
LPIIEEIFVKVGEYELMQCLIDGLTIAEHCVIGLRYCSIAPIPSEYCNYMIEIMLGTPEIKE